MRRRSPVTSFGQSNVGSPQQSAVQSVFRGPVLDTPLKLQIAPDGNALLAEPQFAPRKVWQRMAVRSVMALRYGKLLAAGTGARPN